MTEKKHFPSITEANAFTYPRRTFQGAHAHLYACMDTHTHTYTPREGSE